MADDKKAAEPGKPDIDIQALSDKLMPQLNASIQQAASTAAQAAAQAAIRGSQPVPKAPEMDELGKVLQPHIQQGTAPVAQQAQQAMAMAMGANDFAKFYTLHPEAKEYMKDVEEKFNDLMQANNAHDRESIWLWYKGLNEDKFFERKLAEKNAQLEAAKRGQTVGVGPGGVGTMVTEDPWRMTSDQLAEAMKGREF